MYRKHCIGSTVMNQPHHNPITTLPPHAPCCRVGTPSIYWDFTSRRVLTMEWIEGVKLTDKEGMRRLGLSVVDFVDVGIECTLR